MPPQRPHACAQHTMLSRSKMPSEQPGSAASAEAKVSTNSESWARLILVEWSGKMHPIAIWILRSRARSMAAATAGGAEERIAQLEAQLAEKDDIIDITDSRKAKEASEESGRSTGRYSDGRWIDKNDPRRYADSQYIDKDGMIRGGYDDPVRPPPADVGARDARSKPTVGYDGGALQSIGEKPW